MATSNEEYIKKNKVIIVDDDKNTRLHYACALNNREAVEKELASGRNVDPENYLGWTPLMMAVKNGNASIVELMLSNGADATKKNKFKINVFLISVTCGDLKILEKILEHLLCGGVSRRSLQKIISPLSLAAMLRQNHVVKYLVKRSFDVNIPTPLTGFTPLMYAVAVGNNEAIKYLLHHKADLNMKNCLGKTAIDIFHIRRNKIDIDHASAKKSNIPPPLILVTSVKGPVFQLSPYSDCQNVRRSSNVDSPQILASPNVTPITPQFFFSPNFSPAHYVTPNGYGYDVLNSNLTMSKVFSPLPTDVFPSN